MLKCCVLIFVVWGGEGEVMEVPTLPLRMAKMINDLYHMLN